MPWWTWVALGFFAAVVLFGTAIVVIALIRTRRFRATGGEIGLALDDLTHKAEELERRLERAGERAELVEGKVAQVNSSMERLSVLTWALGDVGRTIAAVRAAVTPRK